jgi:hypothetical protein
MKKLLMTTVAAAAMAGVSTLALAQAGGQGNEHGGTGAMHQPSGAGAQGGAGAMHQEGGAAMHQEGGAAMKPPSGQSAQQSGGKAQERMGQTGEPNKAQRGAEQKGAQEEQRGTMQKGAQEERRGTEQKGAQEEQRGTEQRGAQQENRNGVNANERNAQVPQGRGAEERGASAQLSQDQRSRIAAVVGKGSTARYTGNVDFSIQIGSALPRRVHVEVLPEDIVEIVPQYRGFDYVLVGEQILIVDPRTLEIVAIVPA